MESSRSKEAPSPPTLLHTAAESGISILQQSQGSTISSNTASISGGGIYTMLTIALTDSVISSNSAVQNGGGIASESYGELIIGGNSQITGNRAKIGRGGGVYSTNSKVTLNGANVFVKNNKAASPPSAGLLVPGIWNLSHDWQAHN